MSGPFCRRYPWLQELSLFICPAYKRKKSGKLQSVMTIRIPERVKLIDTRWMYDKFKVRLSTIRVLLSLHYMDVKTEIKLSYPGKLLYFHIKEPRDQYKKHKKLLQKQVNGLGAFFDLKISLLLFLFFLFCA